MNHSSSCVAVYLPSLASSDEINSISDSIDILLSLDYSANKLSVIGKGSSQGDDAIGLYKAFEKTHFKGKQDEFWQSIWRLLAGEAFFLIPDFGSLTVAGGLSSILSTETLDKTCSQEFTALGKALHCLGIPENSILRYESTLKSGQVLLIIHGSNQQVAEAGDILEALQNSNEVSLHFVN